MDKFFRGLTAGIIGGILMNIWSMISFYFLQFAKLQFLDWSAVILYRHFPINFFEALYALIIQILWVGFLGIIFAFLLPVISYQGYLLKGVFYVLILGFFIYATPILLQTPYLSNHLLFTVLSNHIGGAIWGLTMAQTLFWLEKKYGEEV